jgi:peptide/nickel transport system permease protein
LGGTVVTETVFAWPGAGLLTVQALQNDDFPVIQAAVFFLAFIFVFINLAVDLLYAWLDPRIRYD